MTENLFHKLLVLLNVMLVLLGPHDQNYFISFLSAIERTEIIWGGETRGVISFGFFLSPFLFTSIPKSPKELKICLLAT